MLFRSRRPDTPVTSRFGSDIDLFAFRREGDLFVAEIAASPEHAVDLFHTLSEQMPPVVDFSLTCLRSKPPHHHRERNGSSPVPKVP